MSELTLERMRREHLPAVLALEKRLFPTPWTPGMFRQEIDDSILSRPRVAMVGDVLVGYIIPWFVRGEVHLLNIAVSPDHQRKGYATAMMRDLIEQALAAGSHLITLEVRMSNEGAQALYKRFGFVAADVRKDYYEDDHEDALVMLLDLSERAGG